MKKLLSLILAVSILLGIGTVPATAEAETSTQIIHNIFESYAENGLSEDGNMLWLLPDMMAYQELFPDSECIVSNEEKQACLQMIIESVENSNSPGTLAKSIIALRSMGFDARRIVTDESGEIDIVSRLTNLVDEENSSVTIIWTLPYVLIALQQGEDYMTDEQEEFLITTLLEKKSEWQDMSWGPDTATPVIFALSPYYNENGDVKDAIDETLQLIFDLQSDTGIIGNAASTGLTMAALASIGINPQEIVNSEKTLIDGIMTEASENLDGFEPMSNSFSTEQGFRGLLAWKFLKNDLGRVYDFADYPYNVAYETEAELCAVTFDTTPSDVTVLIEGETPTEEGVFMLSCGDYEYTASKSGYRRKTGTFTVNDEDISGGEEKRIQVTLRKRSSGDISSTSNEIDVTVKVLVHGDNCNNEYTYKNNKDEFEILTSGKVTIDKGDSVYHAFSKVMEREGIDFAEENGYVSQIGEYAEFDHGNYSGWMFTVDGKDTNTGCRETKLTKDSTVLWYYTDDYTKEKSEDAKDDEVEENVDGVISFGLVGKNDDITFKPIINKGKTFSDIENCDGKKEIEALSERGIINGKAEKIFEPDATMTRAEFATIVVCALGLPEKNGVYFEDISNEDWYSTYIKTANFYSIVSGISGNKFNPEGTITLEEATVMLTRAGKLCGLDTEMNILSAKDILERFSDFNIVSSWSVLSMGFCVKEGIIESDSECINPKKEVNREEMAVMIYRLLGKAKLL